MSEIAEEYWCQTTNSTEAEQLRSFDTLASIDMMRFDLERHGRVLPETMARVFVVELTYMAEGIDRPLCTEFTFQDIDGEMAYFDRGEWRPYIGTLITGLETAEREAKLDPRKDFAAERAAFDLKIGYQLRGLAPGQSLTWDSPFPDEVLERYEDGAKLLGSMGYQPQRRMGFLYHASKGEDGSMTLRSQSVDTSDADAFAAARDVAERDGNLETMRAAYDQTLSAKYECDFYAGRPVQEQGVEGNAWTELTRHTDLLDHFFRGLNVLAERTDLPRAELEVEKKRLTYGVWAALKRRLDSGTQAAALRHESADDPAALEQEIRYAYALAAARAEVLFGCGGAIGADEAILAAEGKEVHDMIFGKKQQPDDGPCEFTSKICPSCGAKNVKTVRTKTHIRGACGCSKRL